MLNSVRTFWKRRRYVAGSKAAAFGFCCVVAVGTVAAFGASSAAAQLPDTLSSEVRVSIVTTLPGDEIYAAFAHTALRFRDDVLGYDIAFNYGTFDSRDPLFVPKFMYGELDYFLDAATMRGLMAIAEYGRRSVIEQTLNLNPATKRELYIRLKENALPENRVYRYDFLRENCATKVLDLLRDVSGTSIRFDSSGVESESFRDLLEPYLTRKQALDAGIDLLLGSTTDQKATYFQRSFLPMELMNSLDRTFEVTDSTSAPLVARRDTVLWYPGRGLQPAGFPWLPLALWILLLAWFSIDLRFRKTDPAADRWLFGVVGVIGLLLLLMWVGTIHTVTKANWNLVWALPTHLLVAAAWNRISVKTRTIYFSATGALLIFLVIAQPFLIQTLHPAFVPIVASLFWRSYSNARR
jgi:Domain of unknown function (DUF4105)